MRYITILHHFDIYKRKNKDLWRRYKVIHNDYPYPEEFENNLNKFYRYLRDKERLSSGTAAGLCFTVQKLFRLELLDDEKKFIDYVYSLKKRRRTQYKRAFNSWNNFKNESFIKGEKKI